MRVRQIQAAVARLEQYLKNGTVRVIIGPQGAVTFSGWKDRDDVTDVCAYRTLASSRSEALRRAVQRAEASQGRKVNEQVVAAGVHSHDGGKTWGSH